MSSMYGGEYNNFVEFHHPAISVPLYLQLTAADGSIIRRRTLVEEHPPTADDFPYPLTDDFLMYTYKVRRCPMTRSHIWMECPYAHRGEKARRRDPRKFPYTGVVCGEFRRTGDCQKGFNCECAHGVFEFWLHPTRYRTRLCESGMACSRRVCFFAHNREQLRPEGGSAIHHRMFFTPDPAPTTTTTTTTTSQVTGGSSHAGMQRGVVVGSGGGGGGSTTTYAQVVEDRYYQEPDISWIEDLIK